MLVAGQYGAVSALDLSSNGERLLVGYARGLVREREREREREKERERERERLSESVSQITHWDLTTHRLLRLIEDAHPPGFAVINIRV